MGSRTYSARVMRFRQGVYATRSVSAGCKLLLLRLSDDMNQNCIVSVPRTKLAADLACAEARVSEWFKQAKEAGLLSVVKPAKRGRTTVFQGLIEVRPAVPQSGGEWGTDLRTPSGYAHAYPNDGQWGTPSTHPTEVVQTAVNGEDRTNHLGQRGQDEVARDQLVSSFTLGQGGRS